MGEAQQGKPQLKEKAPTAPSCFGLRCALSYRALGLGVCGGQTSAVYRELSGGVISSGFLFKVIASVFFLQERRFILLIKIFKH